MKIHRISVKILIWSIISKLMTVCIEMIPAEEYVDHAWSEFERYSTNSYIRQLLDDRAAGLTREITTDVV